MEKYGREYAEATKDWYKINYAEMLFAMYQNSIIIDGLPKDVPQSFITWCLLHRGRVVYLEPPSGLDSLRGFYIGVPTGDLDRYGNPASFNCITFIGQSVGQYSAEYAKELRVSANALPPEFDILRTAGLLASVDVATNVNILNSTTNKIIPVNDDKVANAIKKVLSDKYLGVPATVITAKTADAVSDINAVDVSAPYVADRLRDLYSVLWAEQLKRLGIVASSQFKRERVQSAEVESSVGETIDFIYITIDQFNSDAERHGLPFRARLNTYAQRYDTDPENSDNKETEITENE